MMSSFRPDHAPAENAFVPLHPMDATRGGVPEDGFVAGEGRFGVPESDSTRGRGEDVIDVEAAGMAAPEEQMHHLTQTQLEEIEAAAFARGEAAAEEGTAALEAACAVIEKAGLELKRSAASDLAANREGTLALAAEMARAWVGASLQSDMTLFGSVLDGVLEQLEGGGEAQVFLSPSTLAVFESSEAARVESWGEKFGVVLRADPAISAADFRIATESHHVDGRLDAVRARMVEALSDAVEAAPPEATE